ncbi:FCD domain-containing protein [Paracoccus yeei]|uniref:FCD domain-containing protein n=1 Tax=Paracoccus yeei TaxID=147645 RepID=UPI0028D7045C|nr:FCD domain-containing protein [Paracoccus yeei]
MTALGTTDRGFHFRIAQASRNDNPALWQRSAVEHRRIYDAIVDRDPEMSAMMMRRHIASARPRRSVDRNSRRRTSRRASSL